MIDSVSEGKALSLSAEAIAREIPYLSLGSEDTVLPGLIGVVLLELPLLVLVAGNIAGAHHELGAITGHLQALIRHGMQQFPGLQKN